MRIETRRTRVIVMTHEEHQAFLDTMQKAKEGQTAHYAEKQLADGSFLGVSIVPQGESDLQATPKEPQTPEDAHRERLMKRPSAYKPAYNRGNGDPNSAS